MRIADSIIRLHHRKGTPALARICRPHSLSLSSWRFFWCLCVFFFDHAKAEPRTGFNFDLGSALTLLWRLCETLKNTKKRPATQATSSPYWKARRPWGRGWLRKLQHKPTALHWQALARRSAMRTPELTRGGRASCPRGAVSLGGATLGPVPSLLPLNRSFCVACRPMFGLKNSVFLWWKCVGEVFKVS